MCARVGGWVSECGYGRVCLFVCCLLFVSFGCIHNNHQQQCLSMSSAYSIFFFCFFQKKPWQTPPSFRPTVTYLPSLHLVLGTHQYPPVTKKQKRRTYLVGDGVARAEAVPPRPRPRPGPVALLLVVAVVVMVLLARRRHRVSRGDRLLVVRLAAPKQANRQILGE